MGTLKTYLVDSSIVRERAMVTHTGTAPDGRPWVRLDHTIFHPQGGGQKADHGRIGGIAVLHVAHAADGDVDHFIATSGLTPGAYVDLEVDPVWRQICARLHSAGHLLAAVGERGFPQLRAAAGHHWPGEARVEFDGGVQTDELEHVLREELARAASSDLEISVVGDPYRARAIQIGAFVAVPCGGTHVRRVSEIGRVTITKIRLKAARLRLSYTIEDVQHIAS